MFWGGIIHEKQPLKSQDLLGSFNFAVLHLSNAILVGNNKTLLYINDGKNPEVCIADLSGSKKMTKLNLYINCTQSLTLMAKGSGEVHLSGYFEPRNEQEMDEYFWE